MVINLLKVLFCALGTHNSGGLTGPLGPTVDVGLETLKRRNNLGKAQPVQVEGAWLKWA